ncbi:MAG: hypothetical protein ACOZAQ_02170 [Pseudomonadota bacterium]
MNAAPLERRCRPELLAGVIRDRLQAVHHLAERIQKAASAGEVSAVIHLAHDAQALADDGVEIAALLMTFCEQYARPREGNFATR